MASTGEQTARRTLPERARALAALADEHGARAEARGALTDEVIDGLHREGILGMWVPSPLGGAELDTLSSLQVIEHLSYGDPSVGWVAMASALQNGTAGAYLGDDAVAELFSGERMPVIAGQGTRPGNALPTDGGFLLSGSWSFGSGIKHASYTHSLGAIEGTHDIRIFVAPIGEAQLIDNWDVLGLRATGSIDYTMDSVFVPESYTHSAFTYEPKRGGALFGLGIIGFVTIGHCGWALGISRRLLDELTSLVQTKAGRPGALADSDSFQEDYAKAQAKDRAARALAYETWSEVRDTFERGDRLPLRLQTMMRLSLLNATWSAQEVGTFVYIAAGTTALRSGRLQQLFRDLYSGTQHITSSPPVWRMTARELAGLAPGKVWRFMDLVDPA